MAAGRVVYLLRVLDYGCASCTGRTPIVKRIVTFETEFQFSHSHQNSQAYIIAYNEIFQTLAVGECLPSEPLLDLGFKGVFRGESSNSEMF